MANGNVGSPDPNQLRLILIELFNLSELKDISFALKVDYDLLAGEDKGSKARELVDYMRRHGRVQDLIIAIQTARPNANLGLQMPVDQPSPYRGLFAFDEKNAANFFGREIYTDMLFTAVEKQPFIAFVGSSGSGKSSVVFAGLIPRLRTEGRWQIIAFRPGDRPFYNLAAALVSLDETLTGRIARLEETQRLARALGREEDPLSLNNIIFDLLKGKEEGARLLLVVDQFEELYTFGAGTAKTNRLLDVLLALNDATPTVLLLTLRADFKGQALEYRPFADALQNHEINLGPMTTEELRRAIRYPAQNAGVNFEPGLEDRIVRDLEDEPGNLPLLQFALTQIWERQVQQKLTHAAYEEIGRVDGALAHYADQVYADIKQEDQPTVRDVFTQLINPGQGTEDTRRLALRSELSADDWQVAQQLATARLVVMGRDDDGRETIEVVHEALIRSWNKLRSWLEADRTFLTWLGRLRLALEMWQQSQENEGALLQGMALDEARIWLAERGDDLAQVERAYIEASIERQERLARRIRWVAIALIVIILMGGLWLFRSGLLIRCRPDCSNWGWLLYGVNWFEKDLNEAILADANLTRTNLILADLQYANLQEANLQEAFLILANLQGANLREANLTEANLTNANLTNANLTNADLTSADLSDANLTDADLTNANLTYADLIGTDLSDANLSGANLFFAGLSGANLSGENLSGARLSRANLSEANLSEADLSRAFLRGANLNKADLIVANLGGADLSGADLGGTDLRGANLNGANLIMADLSGADLFGADLFEADLSDANLSGADLSGVDLSDANLSGADLSGADAKGAKLRGTTYTIVTIWPDGFDPESVGAILVENDSY